MASEDSLALLSDLCHISSSQEDYLSRCRFAGEPDAESSSDDDYEDIPVASTGIMMVSPPDSLEEREHEVTIPRDNDVFHTPPEEAAMGSSQEQQQTVVVDCHEDRAVERVANDGNFAAADGNCTDNLGAVDLGRDTDIGFSAETELTERIEINTGSQSSPGVNQVNQNEVTICESINFSVRGKELEAGDGLCESPVKKLKIVDKNLGLASPEPCSGSDAARTFERVARFIEKLKSSSKNSKNLNENLALETPIDASGAKAGNLGKTVKSLSFQGNSPRDSLKSLQNHQIEEVNGGDRILQGTSSAKRKLLFHPEALESHLGDSNAVSAPNEDKVESQREEIEDDEADRSCDISESSSIANSQGRQTDREFKSIDDIDQFRYVDPAGAHSSEKHKDFRAKRILPISLWANIGKGAGEVVPVQASSPSKDEEARRATLFDVLREIAQHCTFDPRLANLSVLEAAKMRGMTFP